MLPDRRSLVERVSDHLAAEISRGLWEEWLPRERELAQSLGVSRNTLRAALGWLHRRNLIEPLRGRGHRILKGSASRRKKTAGSHPVVILSPEPLDRLRPALGILIDELRVLLFRAGLNLEVHNGGRDYRSGSARLLDKLVSQYPAACWVLIRSGEQVQTWFARQKIPCVISGSAYPQINLPSVDVDLRAIGSHAAGRLLGLGHRHLLFMRDASTAGLNACEEGFRGVIEKTPHAAATILHHSSNVGEVRRQFTRQMTRMPRPTGILVASSYYYLTVSGILHQLGLSVPRDVSLMCTDSDHFLPYMVPEACHYDFDHKTFARKLAQRIKGVLDGNPAVQPHARLFPSYVAGDSVARPSTKRPRI